MDLVGSNEDLRILRDLIGSNKDLIKSGASNKDPIASSEDLGSS